jgi:hypothetical protein
MAYRKVKKAWEYLGILAVFHQERTENCSGFSDFPDIYRPDPRGGKMCF